ncbi:hypothetical protein DFH06DRAFT_671715 [Mycena polygramma]|nr:hypothetical protein DFH06DRAFT_671715 [Mycena polygramma]
MIVLVRCTIYSCVSPSSNGVSPRIADTLSDTLIHRTKRPADDALQGRHCRPMTCPAHAQAAGRRKISIDLRSLFRPRLRVPRLRTVRCPDAEITRPRSLLQLFPRLGYPARRTFLPFMACPSYERVRHRALSPSPSTYRKTLACGVGHRAGEAGRARLLCSLQGRSANPADKKRIDDLLQKGKQKAAEIHQEERERGMEEKQLDDLLRRPLPFEFSLCLSFLVGDQERREEEAQLKTDCVAAVLPMAVAPTGCG